MNYNQALSQRYSVKKFDTNRNIPQPILNNILTAGKLSASSLGLQPYRIVVIESDALKQRLIPIFKNPSQVSTCSHLVVIVTKKNIEDSYLEGYLTHITQVREIPMTQLELFRQSIRGYIETHTEESLWSWNEKQSYIVLGNLMFAAALESVDSCPMEGFDAAAMNQILELDTTKEAASVTLALGYRAEDDTFQHYKKVRKPDDKLFQFL
ncbi:NAD(P)H-dependent oxidoreductase [Riemerella columbina]|uniref:NAD(P)H-dependent oxidoreductase n=1 Tax=Riemerella columbina TaxID=103810 RepID=UPI0026705071|nr:NAD(P)H-dependent oxidoreductase [Riemerella columbina]WKS95011.1 NAD(P)H-dependent oxidoreductase [Riemerella columbina]